MSATLEVMRRRGGPLSLSRWLELNGITEAALDAELLDALPSCFREEAERLIDFEARFAEWQRQPRQSGMTFGLIVRGGFECNGLFSTVTSVCP
jgi:hypothetical protein